MTSTKPSSASRTPVPKIFHPVRAKAARFAGLDARAFEQLLATEYEPGAASGSHRGRAIFAARRAMIMNTAWVEQLR